MSKANKKIEVTETNPYWPGCHIIDCRDTMNDTVKEHKSRYQYLYKPLSVQSLEEAFGDESEESDTDDGTNRCSKYSGFPDISTDNNTLSVLNLSDDVNCMTLSLVGEKLPIHFLRRSSPCKKFKHSPSKSSENKKYFLASSIAYHHDDSTITLDKTNVKGAPIKTPVNENSCDNGRPVVCFVVLMEPWTIIEIGKIAKNSNYQIHSDIQKIITFPRLLKGEKRNLGPSVYSRIADESQEYFNFDVFPLDCNSIEITNHSNESLSDKVNSVICSQSIGGSLTHFLHPSTYFAYDFDVQEGTDIRAMADGIVIEANDSSSCFGPDSRNLFKANQISIEIFPLNENSKNSYQPRFIIEYVHIQKNSIPICFKKVGALVKKGDVIAKSGRAGFTPTPHLHLQVVQKFEINDKNKIFAAEVKECVEEITSLGKSCGVINGGVLNYQDLLVKSSKTKKDLILLDQKLNQLKSYFEDNESDNKDDYLRIWIKDMIISNDMKEIDIQLLQMIPEYLNISDWSVPFKIQGQQFEQGQKYFPIA